MHTGLSFVPFDAFVHRKDELEKRFLCNNTLKACSKCRINCFAQKPTFSNRVQPVDGKIKSHTFELLNIEPNILTALPS